MRDYSFGNFISAQRERCGLSQYQLGALVGVSDKAVSKWENGVSKPRTAIMLKLSEVLEISVDELLTCEYVSSEKRKDLFAMKKDILKVAKKRLMDVYGDNPSFVILNRFEQEKLMLEEREMLLWIGFFGKLQEKTEKTQVYFSIRGAQMGASFVAWLLGATMVNPLPAHYYCPNCKKVEFVMSAKCGLDMDDKKCTCGCRYKKDGFDIDAIHMYPLVRWNEIDVSKNGTKLVEETLREFFCEGNVREIKICSDEEKLLPGEPKATRYGLISDEMVPQYPDKIMEVYSEEYYRLVRNISTLTVVENAKEEMCRDDFMNEALSKEQINEFFQYSVKNGRYYCKESNVNLDKIVFGLEEVKFSDLLVLSGLLHGTGVWEENAEILYADGISLGDLISNREDVYAYLYDKLKNTYYINPSGLVYEIKESVRKGKYRSAGGGMPEEIEKLLLESDVPVWYVESMKKIAYLFPKAHLVTRLKWDIGRYLSWK